ncbi:MAG: alpha/beta hydrolase [Alphaproteobacteria bacterium]|nr:alpha/beta hydrolase [Alphaproteobacteria bacterium]
MYTLLILYVAAAATLFLLQRQLMYFPNMAPEINETFKPDFVQKIEITTASNHKIKSWFIAPQDNNQDIIIWFHGNASDYKNTLPLTYKYIDKRYGVFLAEYPGYAGNPGKPTEDTFYDSARSSMNWLIAKGYSAKNIILYGQSIGSGPATQMAVEFPDVKALILEAPFSSALNLAQKRFFFLPVKYLMHDKYENDKKISGIKTPLMIVHGEQDRIIPATHSETLIELSNAQIKHRLVVENASHNDLFNFDIESDIIAFLKELE